MKFASYGVYLHLQLTGYSVTAARVLWEDLVSVQIRVPRLRVSYSGYYICFPSRG